MDARILQAFDAYIDNKLEQVVISGSSEPERVSKITIRPVLLQGSCMFQVTKYVGKQVHHQNFGKEELLTQLPCWFEGLMHQAQLSHADATVHVLYSKKGTVTVKTKKRRPSEEKTVSDLWAYKGPEAHNREKRYLLPEGTPIPFMRDLGVFTTEGKVVQAKYDKYRQINRFLEFIEDILPEFGPAGEKKLSILDFGCGKSYLTFAMYYYLHEVMGYRVSITGLDLKADVIKRCNSLAEQYGYDGLHFLIGDIAQYQGTEQIDMVVTLHACDTATDYALLRAVQWNAGVILSVPCCQHELNQQLDKTILSPLLSHGLIKERMAALMTDAFRAELLESVGYRVQVLEFIDMEHTPKNILLRAVRRMNDTKERQQAARNRCIKMAEELSVHPTLLSLLERRSE